jgi:hypothetical protein
MALAVPQYGAPGADTLGPLEPWERAVINRIDARRVALQGDQQQLRERYDEIMRWINPPWDPESRRIDPRPELATAARQGEPMLHVDLVSQVVERWTALEAGAPVIVRFRPQRVSTPIDTGDQARLEEARKRYNIERAAAQDQASQIESQTNDWMEQNDFHRLMAWACWSKEAFGKGIIKTGWDPVDGIPTAELMENPSQVYYAWTNRYGRRQIAWAMVADFMDASEANARYGLNIPIDEVTGAINYGAWFGQLDMSQELDYRPEQQQALNRMVWAEEYWELVRDRQYDGQSEVMFVLAVGGRVIDGPTFYPWKKVPFHILENSHVLTYMHGKSVAESMIPLNAAYDTMLDRQDQVIAFEAGPRYKGLNMAASSDEADLPDPFQLLPLREGEDIQQIETRVDFFPTQLHAEELRMARYNATGLTPIAWGMSPNAQTSGRALSAEWRAVELPLHIRLINIGPEVKGIVECWWDYAEEYNFELRVLTRQGLPGQRDHAQPLRRFKILFEPLDIRDKSERVQEVLARFAAGALDMETLFEELGYENVDEMIAKLKAFFLDPVLSPLRYQQYLTLQQLELQIRQQAAEVEAMEQQGQQGAAPVAGGGGAAPGQPNPAEMVGQGNAAAAEASQVPVPATEAQNQPGEGPLPAAGAAMPLGGGYAAAPPTAGVAPR